MNVLGIETSCDETAAAVVGSRGILADVTVTQAGHAAFGGVVPEIAARGHVELLPSLVRQALAEAGLERPDAVAATTGPGLAGALLVGLSFGQALALGFGVPFVSVNHLEAHLLSAQLENPELEWPFLGLVVSGGHTALYLSAGLGSTRRVAETVDDAAGEAYDKVARMLGLGWPGGPAVDRMAASGDPRAVRFPRPAPGGLDWSFSGLKTAVRQHLSRPDRASDADVCASFQAAVVEVLCDRVVRAARELAVPRVALAGGVAANSELRRVMSSSGLQVFLPARSRCTDNGAMVAYAGRLHALAGHVTEGPAVARPDWELE